MRRITSLIFALVLVFTAVPWAGSAMAASGKVRYFPETGHNVIYGFLTYWNNHGGLDRFGFPITEEFQQVSPTDGKTYTVQFFERAVFEYHPEFAPGPYETELRLLGSLTTQGRTDPGFQPTTPFTSTNDRWYFSQTGHGLSFGFKNYWLANGGLDMFGYPLSEEFSEVSPTDGKTYTVQYFERARFEYHPEFAPGPYETEMGLLGSEHARTSSLPDSLLQRVDPIPSPDTPPPFPLKGPSIGYGMNAQLFYVDRGRVLGLLKDAGFGWVKQQVTWYDIEGSRGQYSWGELDRVVNDAYGAGVKLILSVTRAPSWATSDGGHGMPADPADLGNFMQAMATHYQGKVAAYEIWNEQNTGGETNGHVDAGRYVELLKAGFTGVKAGDPWAIVLYGGLTPTGVNDPAVAIDDKVFLGQTYQYQNGVVKNYFDALGAHPGSNSNSPDQFWPDNPGPYGWSNDRSFYFRRVEDLRDVMVQYGDGNKQIWLTEFGWTTANQAPGYEYGQYISDDLQAQYLVRAYEKAVSEYPWMGVMSLWNLNFSTIVPASDEKAPWSIIRGDWSLRPAYTALKNMPK
ncbi:MAG: cellulase family glycosylhydrolase [Chloroflexi bacterium]|nr:cellulase family glycosylhydrolase [Chloroflexota bacterium]